MGKEKGDENKNWDIMLKILNGIVEKTPPDAEAQINSLKELAKTKNLTPRQSEGIEARCENYLNGTYGNTKTPENFGHGSVSPSVTKAQQNGKP